MKIRNAILLSLTTCLLSITQFSLAQPQSKPEQKQPVQQPLNRIVAIVNDEVISESDLNLAIDQLKQQYIANKLTPPSPDKLREVALQQLINFRLQLQMAKRYDVKPTPEELTQTIQQIAQSHNLTIDQLKLELSKQNINYDEFVKKLNQQLSINKLQQQMVAGQIKITDADVQAYRNSPSAVKEFKLLDFFFPLSETPTETEIDTALKQAKLVQQQLNNGVSPSDIKAASQDLGWRTVNDLPQIFVEQLSNLNKNNASLPLKAPNGYHVLKLMDVRNANQNLTDDQIRQIVFRNKYEEAVKAAVDKARKEAFVEIIP